MKKKVLCWILMTSFLSCNSKDSLTGIYSSNTKNTMVNQTLFLNKDSTFKFVVKGDLTDMHSFGRWSLNKNGFVALRSDSSLRAGVVGAKEKSFKSQETFNIEVMTGNGLPLGLASIIIDDDFDNVFNLDENGWGEYIIDDPKSIRVSYLGNDYYYSIVESETNFVSLKIRLQTTSTYFFDDELWKVKGRKLLNNNYLVLRRKNKFN